MNMSRTRVLKGCVFLFLSFRSQRGSQQASARQTDAGFTVQLQRHQRAIPYQTSKKVAQPRGVQFSLQNLQALFALSPLEAGRQQTRGVSEFRHTDESKRDLHVEIL